MSWEEEEEKGSLILQAFYTGHAGVDNLNMVRLIGKMFARAPASRSLDLVEDGFLIHIRNIIERVVKGEERISRLVVGRFGLWRSSETIWLMP